MLGDLSPAQRALADLMSDLSEEAYCAGWMDGLEYALWEVVRGERSDYGRLVFAADARDRLMNLSAECGGWIIFDDLAEETWVELREWETLFEQWRLRSEATNDGEGA